MNNYNYCCHQILLYTALKIKSKHEHTIAPVSNFNVDVCFLLVTERYLTLRKTNTEAKQEMNGQYMETYNQKVAYCAH
jgi:hypothetical protein